MFVGRIVHQPYTVADLCYLSEDAGRNHLMVERNDFIYAIEHEMQPKYGVQNNNNNNNKNNNINNKKCTVNNNKIINKINNVNNKPSNKNTVFINYGPSVDTVLCKSSFWLNCLHEDDNIEQPVSLLIQGGNGCGKTTTAMHIAYSQSECPYVAVLSPQSLVGKSGHEVHFFISGLKSFLEYPIFVVFNCWKWWWSGKKSIRFKVQENSPQIEPCFIFVCPHTGTRDEINSYKFKSGSD